MTPFLKPFPRYVCYKQVGALQIKAVIPNPRGVELHFVDETFVPIQMDLSWVAEHGPVAGDYLVVYDEGYMSRSPAKAFEEGYTKIEDPRIMPSMVSDLLNPPT